MKRGGIPITSKMELHLFLVLPDSPEDLGVLHPYRIQEIH
jgi:hypothetical protein